MRRKFKTKIDELDYNFQVTLGVTQLRLDRISKGRLKLQRVRATLGEIYNHARRGEVLVTLDRQDPQVVMIENLGIWIQKCRDTKRGVLATWSGILTMATTYSKKRKKVVHPWERKK